MKKQDIINENIIALDALRTFYEEAPRNFINEVNFTRLRSCNARVATFSGYTVLFSYNTLVAFIKDGILYDVLRYVYGYTSTSAQHIAQFARDYGAKERHTWRGKFNV